MVKLTRKQRELRDREDLILTVARRMLLERGYHGLTMDRIAAAIEYSKGTIYLHFPCKEEVLIAVAIGILERRQAVVEHAIAFPGKTRERMVAIGEAVELFAQLYPDDLHILEIIKTEVITQKVSAERLAEMKRKEFGILEIMAALVREAMENGELSLPSGTVPEELAFALWAITEGGHGIILRGVPLAEVGVSSPYHSLMKSCDVLGDGYGWRPLANEWDYEATRRRLRETVLAEETAALKAARGA